MSSRKGSGEFWPDKLVSVCWHRTNVCLHVPDTGGKTRYKVLWQPKLRISHHKGPSPFRMSETYFGWFVRSRASPDVLGERNETADWTISVGGPSVQNMTRVWLTWSICVLKKALRNMVIRGKWNKAETLSGTNLEVLKHTLQLVRWLIRSMMKCAQVNTACNIHNY